MEIMRCCLTLRHGLAALLVFGTPIGVGRAAAQDRWAAPAVVSHRYRIAGKVRLVFLWVSSDHVGSARITWQQDSTVSAISLLIGSDPQRAPRGLNEWGYLQERVHDHEADVFGVRTLSDAGSREDVQAGAGRRSWRLPAIRCPMFPGDHNDRSRAGDDASATPGDLSYRRPSAVARCAQRIGCTGKRVTSPGHPMPSPASSRLSRG